ncbi:MAG TPA: DUF4232 domain-containing protein [Solirubrobacteraceae bacterium]|nr:DUF4232 domain-containing protein [Solirubrobacteraceae bacterium]
MPTLAPAPAILTAAAIALLPSASASAAEMPVARCSIHQLRVHAEGSGIAAGSELSEFAFVNRGARACRLFGYPRLTMLGRAGRALKTSDRNAPPGFDGVREGVVTLGAGAQAWFGVYYADRTGYGTLTCPTATRLRFTPPQLKGTITLAGKGARITPYGGSVEHLQCGDVMLTPVSAKRLLPARSR